MKRRMGSCTVPSFTDGHRYPADKGVIEDTDFVFLHTVRCGEGNRVDRSIIQPVTKRSHPWSVIRFSSALICDEMFLQGTSGLRSDGNGNTPVFSS